MLLDTGFLMKNGAKAGGEISARISHDGAAQFVHIGAVGAAPILTPGPAVGAGGKAVIAPNSSDVAGKITITTGSNVGVGEIVTLNFHHPYAQAPFAQISAAAPNTARALNSIYVDTQPGSMKLVAESPLPQGATLVINYQNIGH